MKRVLAMLLLLVMIVSLTACPGSEDPNKGGGGGGEVDYLDTIGDKDFGGAEIVFSSISSYAYEIYYEEEEPDACDEELYNRNSRLEERFNVTITPMYQEGQGADDHTTDVRNTIMNGLDDFDVSMVQIWMTGPLITDGWFLNLREYIPYVKDSIAKTDWWSADINNAYTIYGKQYVGVSDINLSAIKTTWCYLFNKGKVEDEGIASKLGYGTMYEVVRNNKWTLDTVYNLIKDYYTDNTETTTGIDERDDGDTYGLLSSGGWWMEIQTSACGVQLVLNDGETTPEITPFTNFNSVVEGISKIYTAKGFYAPTSTGALDKFAEDTALMVMTTFSGLESDTIHDSDVEFGVLPMPKASEAQKKYHAGSQDAMTSIEVPTTSFGEDRLECIGALLEAMSAESHRAVLPAYYDVILKHKNTRDEESIEMIELIYEGRLYNFAQIHSQGTEQLYCNNPQGGDGTGLFYIMRKLGPNPTMVSTWWEASQDLLTTRLEEIVAMYEQGY